MHSEHFDGKLRPYIASFVHTLGIAGRKAHWLDLRTKVFHQADGRGLHCTFSLLPKILLTFSGTLSRVSHLIKAT